MSHPVRTSVAVVCAAVLLALIGTCLAAEANNASVAVPPPRVCFDTVLTSTPDLVVARQLQRQLCTLWKLDKRHVFGAQYNDDRSQISMVVTYPYAAALLPSGGGSGAPRPPVYLFETYNSITGGMVARVELKQASLPDVSASDVPVSVCITAGDVYISAYSGGASTTVQHFDRVSGERKATKAYDQISASDRVWMTCTDTTMYMSVPAANAVWRLAPGDGLLERIVVRIQSPGAISLDPGLLRVVSGRPALQIHTFDIYDGAHRGQVDVSERYFHLRGISMISPEPFMAAVVDDDGVLSQITDPLVNVVVVNRNLAVHYAEGMLSDGRSAMVNGVPVFIKTAMPITAVSNSQLLNAGNSDKVSFVVYTRNERQLITVDEQGALNLYSSFDHQCPILFSKPLPPLITTESRVIYTDERDWRTPLLYVAVDETTLVLRPSAADSDETIWPSFCPDDGETIASGISTSWPVPITCALCGAELVCAFDSNRGERRAYPLPLEMIGSLSAVRLAWDAKHENVIVFHAGMDIWVLPLEAGLSMDTASWSRLRQFDRLPVVFDITYWDVREIYEDVYALRLASDYILLVTGYSANWTASEGAEFDRTQSVGTKLLLVPNAQTQAFASDSICVGFPLNVTDRDKGMSQSEKDQARVNMIIAITGLAVCGCAGILLCIVAPVHGVDIIRMPWNRKKQPAPFSRLGSEEALEPPPSRMFRLRRWFGFGWKSHNQLNMGDYNDAEQLHAPHINASLNSKDSDQAGGHYTDVALDSGPGYIQPSAAVSAAALAAASPAVRAGTPSGTPPRSGSPAPAQPPTPLPSAAI